MVYSKIDWFTAVIHDVSFVQITDRFGLSIFEDDFLQNAFQRSEGYNDKMIFTYNGISLDVSLNEYVLSASANIFETVYSKVRLDISGTGLDYLRSRGIDVDVLFCSPMIFSQQYNITRCDFAFDFFNEHSDFLDNLIQYVYDKQREERRRDFRLNTGRAGGCKYSFRDTPQEKTFYFGTGRSEKLLRIYDKLLERTDSNGVWKSPKPIDADISSWFRIELQARRDKAQSILESCNFEIRNVLRYIFEEFSIRENGEVLPMFRELFDWSKYEHIILKYDFIQLADTPSVSVERGFGRNLSWLIQAVALYGWRGFQDKVDDYLQRLQISSSDSPSDLRRLRCISSRLIELADDVDIDTHDFKGLYFYSGIFRLKYDR